MVKGSSIVSVSFGETRSINFKHDKTGQLVKYDLPSGSVMVMHASANKYWTHAIPKRIKDKSYDNIGPRLNITFRSFKSQTSK